MPMTLTAYFDAMENAIRHLAQIELSEHEREIQQRFLALCEYGKLLEEKGVVFTTKPGGGEDTLLQQTGELFARVGDEPNGIYKFNSPRLRELAKIYYAETQQLISGHYQYSYKVFSKQFYNEMPNAKKVPLQASLDKIQRSLQHYECAAISPAVTARSGDTSSEDLASDDSSIPVYCLPDKIPALLMAFISAPHLYHAKRAQALYTALVACWVSQSQPSADGLKALVELQIKQATLTKARSGWCRYTHFRHWRDPATHNTLDTAWRKQGRDDLFLEHLQVLKMGLDQVM